MDYVEIIKNILKRGSKMTIGKLGHVAICVKDMDRAVAYYMSLGFNCEWESDDWSYFEEGIALLGPGYNRADPHFAMNVENEDEMNEVRDKLIGMGYECAKPYKHRDGTVSFYTRDPEGNQLEFICQD